MTERSVKPEETETVAKCRVLALKRWLFAMRNMAFHTSIRGLLEKHWFMAEFGLVLMMRLKAAF